MGSDGAELERFLPVPTVPFVCQLESDSHYVWKEEQLADNSVSSNCKKYWTVRMHIYHLLT